MANRDGTKTTHQAVVSKITAVVQRRNNSNKSIKKKDSIMRKITIPRTQSGRIDCRNIATQLVVVEVSGDVTKHRLLISAHEYGQRDSTNKTIVIVTDKSRSAVNCPIKVVIVPLSWLSSRLLSISQSPHCCYQDTNTQQRQRKQDNCNRH